MFDSTVGPGVTLNRLISTNDVPLRIGRQTAAFGSGLVDEVELYNRALSAGEIQDIYDAGSVGKCKAATQIDYYKCYEVAKNSMNLELTPVVDLEDQFSVIFGVTVHRKPEVFCNPVVKDDEQELKTPGAHLACYRVKADKTAAEVAIKNQFGEQTLNLTQTKLLCVPSEKEIIEFGGG